MSNAALERPTRPAGTFEALRAQFVGLSIPEGPSGHTAWEDTENTTVFEFAWSPQHLTATARGNDSTDQMNAIIDAAIDIGGGRLYDPQVGERFA